jgi:hypothetical protein
MDIHDVKGHIVRVLNGMVSNIFNLPRGQSTPDVDVEFLLCGYSWRQKEFRIWRISFAPDKGLFVDEHGKSWGRGRNKFIHFVGDEDAKADAKSRLINIIRSKPSLRTSDFDMEPFEILRDIIRSKQFPSVGGALQFAKIYEHMNVAPFAVYWPNRASDRLTLLGRPLLDYEVPRWGKIDPDSIEFSPEQH